MFELYELTLINDLDVQVLEFKDRQEAIEACERLRFFFKKQRIDVSVSLYFCEYEDDNIRPTNCSEICLDKDN